MKRIVKFVTEKFRDIKSHIWWFFNEKRIVREYEENKQREDALQAYQLKEFEEAEEAYRKADEAYWEEREEARFASYEEEEPDETVENFSEHPSLSAEEEPRSSEMEYWFTPCPKCGKYPEFCPCDGKFVD